MLRFFGRNTSFKIDVPVEVFRQALVNELALIKIGKGEEKTDQDREEGDESDAEGKRAFFVK